MPPHQLRFRRIGIGILAKREQATFTKETSPAGNAERNHHPVAHFEIFYLGTDLDYLAHEFVAKDVSFLHRGDKTIVQMQIGATDGGESDSHDGIAWV